MQFLKAGYDDIGKRITMSKIPAIQKITLCQLQKAACFYFMV